MKTLLVSLLGLLLPFALPGVAAPLPELQFDFNDNDHLVRESRGAARVEGRIVGGATMGGEGSGVTGTANDRAFHNQTAEGIFLLPDVHEVRGKDHLTVTLWYRTENGPISGQGERLADYGKNWLFFSDAPARLTVQVPTGGPGQSAPPGSYETEGWVFAAFTFNAADATVTYYRGGVDAEAVEVGRRSSFTEPMGNESTALQFGNNNARTRAFAGFLDNIKVFATTLNAEEIEAIRRADLGR